MRSQAGTMSPKLTLALLGVMFLIPLTIAWLMHSGVIEYQPDAGLNRGILVDPPVKADVPEQFHEAGLSEHWVIAHVPGTHCDDGCLERIHGLRQVHRALGRDAVRTRILLLADANIATELAEPGPGFVVITTNTGKLTHQFGILGDQHGIFIIDPLGNIMMHYAPEADPNDILFDLERLLQYQKTDPQ